MSAKSDLIENRLESRVRNAASQAREFKSRQRASGASGQTDYDLTSDLTWDYTQVLAPVVSPNIVLVTLLLTFTGSGEQKFPLVIPATDLYANGTDAAHRVKQDTTILSSTSYRWSDGTNLLFMSEFDELDTSLLEDPYVLRWRVSFWYEGNITVYVKAHATGTSEGTLSIVRVS